LRDFNDETLKQPMDEDLRAEDERIEELNQTTLQWWTATHGEV